MALMFMMQTSSLMGVRFSNLVCSMKSLVQLLNTNESLSFEVKFMSLNLINITHEVFKLRVSKLLKFATRNINLNQFNGKNSYETLEFRVQHKLPLLCNFSLKFMFLA